MTDLSMLGLVSAAASGGGVTLVGQWIAAWISGRGTARSADAQIEGQKDSFLLELLKTARTEIASLHTDIDGLRQEVNVLRPLQARVFLVEEALDHLEAVLNAENEDERRLAERRARAFLKRVRPKVGDLRNSAQVAESAKRVISD